MKCKELMLNEALGFVTYPDALPSSKAVFDILRLPFQKEANPIFLYEDALTHRLVSRPENLVISVIQKCFHRCQNILNDVFTRLSLFFNNFLASIAIFSY